MKRSDLQPTAYRLQPLGKADSWPAPAKLNLCLHIVGRRPDGYHLLQSALQFVDLCDQIQFWSRPAGVIERVGGPEEVPPDTDLSIRAARLLATQSPRPVGVAIELHKRIPMQGGMGGGSSDAATVLVALNDLWGIGLDSATLAALGLKLGADVPVFVGGSAAWVEGIGETLTPAEFDEKTYVVLKPDAAVSTAEIFNAPELTRHTPITTIRAFRAQGGRNDCAPTVRARYPKVAEALDWLSQFGEARLTGTGACVFAAMTDRRTAESVRAKAPDRWQAYVVKGLNRSPLLARLAAEKASSE